MTLRTTLLSRRQAITPAQKQLADNQLCQQIITWCQANPVTILGGYLPIRGEPDLDAAYQQLHIAGVRLALPVVREKNAPLVFVAWHPGEPMTTGAFGTAIPQSNAEVNPDVLLLPCVGFNNGRFRLGYGGGFYDRTLAATPRPTTIGVAYDCSEASFGHEAHDIAMDVVITETRQF